MCIFKSFSAWSQDKSEIDVDEYFEDFTNSEDDNLDSDEGLLIYC